MRQTIRLLVLLLAPLLAWCSLAPAPAAAQLDRGRFRIVRPEQPVPLGDTLRLQFESTDALGRPMARQPAARCLSMAPQNVEFERNVVARGRAVGSALSACFWLPGEHGIYFDTVTLVVNQREPNPDSIAQTVFLFCYPRVSRRWLDKAPTITALGDRMWVRALAFNYRGDPLPDSVVQLKSLNPDVLTITPVKRGANTPCGPV